MTNLINTIITNELVINALVTASQITLVTMSVSIIIGLIREVVFGDLRHHDRVCNEIVSGLKKASVAGLLFVALVFAPELIVATLIAVGFGIAGGAVVATPFLIVILFDRVING